MTHDVAGPSVASAGSHGDQCRCGLATRLVGDGCEHCNPAMMIELLREQIADMRFTDEEREAIAWFAIYSDTPGEERHAVVLAKLLERTK